VIIKVINFNERYPVRRKNVVDKVIYNVIEGNMKLKCDILQLWEEDIE